MRRAAQLLIRLYQWTVSPHLGPRCRFYPSCSHYAHEAVGRFGVLDGGLLALKRLAALPSVAPGRRGSRPGEALAMSNPRVSAVARTRGHPGAELPDLDARLRRARAGHGHPRRTGGAAHTTGGDLDAAVPQTFSTDTTAPANKAPADRAGRDYRGATPSAAAGTHAAVEHSGMCTCAPTCSIWTSASGRHAAKGRPSALSAVKGGPEPVRLMNRGQRRSPGMC